MPSQAALAAAGRAQRFVGPGGGSVDAILGDCHGSACAAAITDQAEALLTGLGYSVARNHPYAGGFTTRHHGRPQAGIHALQIEINRSLYMDEGRLARLPRLPEVAADMTKLVRGMGNVAAFARAAE
jgi:N-formylglutamate amidohydrolase